MLHENCAPENAERVEEREEIPNDFSESYHRSQRVGEKSGTPGGIYATREDCTGTEYEQPQYLQAFRHGELDAVQLNNQSHSIRRIILHVRIVTCGQQVIPRLVSQQQGISVRNGEIRSASLSNYSETIEMNQSNDVSRNIEVNSNAVGNGGERADPNRSLSPSRKRKREGFPCSRCNTMFSRMDLKKRHLRSPGTCDRAKERLIAGNNLYNRW